MHANLAHVQVSISGGTLARVLAEDAILVAADSGSQRKVRRARTVPMFSVHRAGQKSKKCAQVEGLPVALSRRHAKIRREGYRFDTPRA